MLRQKAVYLLVTVVPEQRPLNGGCCCYNERESGTLQLLQRTSLYRVTVEWWQLPSKPASPCVWPVYLICCYHILIPIALSCRELHIMMVLICCFWQRVCCCCVCAAYKLFEVDMYRQRLRERRRRKQIGKGFAIMHHATTFGWKTYRALWKKRTREEKSAWYLLPRILFFSFECILCINTLVNVIYCFQWPSSCMH